MTEKQEEYPMEGYERQEGVRDMWIPDNEGDFIEGKVTDIVVGNYGNQYKIEQADGNTVTTPSHKVLQNRLSETRVGDVIKIIFTGTEPPAQKGQNPTMMYEVGIKK